MMERAILYQQVVREGQTIMQAASRPDEVRAVARRVMSWSSERTREGCSVCRAPAVSLWSGQPFCAEHREEYRRSLPVFARKPEVRESEPSSAQIVGHAIVTDVPSLDMGFREIVRPEALDRTLREGTDLRALWNHDSNEPLGRISAGTLSVWRDSVGLAVSIDPPQWASRYVETIQRADVTGASFAFRTLTDEWHLENGEPVRELLDLEISEVSATAFPAYPQTQLGIGPARSGRSLGYFDRKARVVATR